MSIIQWVNLEKDEAYASDPDVGSIDRCGPLSVKAVFARNGIPLNFTVKAVPSGSDNVEYTQAELAPGRNPNFKMPAEISGLAETKETILDNKVKLPAAGGNKYKLEAKDANGVTVQSVEVEVRRKIYYQVLTMEDKNGRVPTYSLEPMISHAEKHFVTLQEKGPVRRLPYRKTISMHRGGNSVAFARDVRKYYDMDLAYRKVGVAAIFSDCIARWADYKLIEVVALGTPKSNISTEHITVRSKFNIWYGMVDEDDAAQTWLVDAVAEYSNPSTQSYQTYFIPRSNLSVVGPPSYRDGGYKNIMIQRDEGLNRLLGHRQGTLKITLELKIVGGWTNGFSWQPWGDDLHLITCSQRPAWQQMPHLTKTYTWNHELGHRLGMVAYGDRTDLDLPRHERFPDSPSTMYSDASGVSYGGHKGPHCGKGTQYDSLNDSWSGQPQCVMFGANGIGSYHAPRDYCSECAPIVRKLDVSE